MARKCIGMLFLFAALVGCARDQKRESTPSSSAATQSAATASATPSVKATVPETAPPPKIVDDTAGFSGDEKALLGQVEQARDSAKLPRLKPNPILTKLARSHAEKMARDNFEGQVEIPAKDYRSQATATSTGVNSKLDPVAVQTQAQKYVSDRDYQEIGVGVVVDPTGRYCYVLIFAQPAP